MRRNTSARLSRPGGKRSIAVLAGLVCLAYAAACQPVLPDGPEGPGDGGIEDRVTGLVNDYRESVGCRRLVWHPVLAGVARSHSADMLNRGYFGHTNPDGEDLRDRLVDAGIRYSLAGENIAMGYRYEDAARAVVEGWINSDGHREIIDNCDFTSHGVGFVEYRWTHLFMR